MLFSSYLRYWFCRSFRHIYVASCNNEKDKIQNSLFPLQSSLCFEIKERKKKKAKKNLVFFLCRYFVCRHKNVWIGSGTDSNSLSSSSLSLKKSLCSSSSSVVSFLFCPHTILYWPSALISILPLFFTLSGKTEKKKSRNTD